MRQEIVNMVVYLYIFICVALLLFNIAYIVYSKQRKRQAWKRKDRMKKMQLSAMSGITKDTKFNQKEEKHLIKKLSNIKYLVGFEEALAECEKERDEKEIILYLKMCRNILFQVAWNFKKKPAMERAYFGYMVSRHLGKVAETYRHLSETLLEYFADSTIYARENVLMALYCLGAEDAIDQAFSRMKVSGYSHQHRLIADGLQTYNGDKDRLAKRLWGNREQYDGEVRIALIQFMSRLPGDYSSLLLPELEQLSGEESFTVIRYFGTRHHVCLEAKEKLLEILKRDDEYSVPAASVLGYYPGEDVKEALMQALGSNLWYVRKNAANALLEFGLTRAENEELLKADDAYAREMFRYVLELKRQEIENRGEGA